MLKRSVAVLAMLFVMTLVARLGAQAPAPTVDLVGKWTATFETQIGPQHYNYEFARKDGVLTASATNDIGTSVITDVKVDKGVVTFAETLKYMDMDISIRYTGTIVGSDEIRFTRNVMEFATEELVAKRVKG
jgi:hypothetical protein